MAGTEVTSRNGFAADSLQKQQTGQKAAKPGEWFATIPAGTCNIRGGG
jgi:hypothetical protein